MLANDYDWGVPGALLGGLLDIDDQIRAYLEHVMAKRGIDLTLRRLHLLQLIESRGPIRPSQLAAFLGVAKRSMTDAIKLLEAPSYVDVSDDPRDRRASIVVIAPAGKRAISEARSALAQVEGELFSTLRTPRYNQFYTTLWFLNVRMREIDKRYPGKVRQRSQVTKRKR